MLLGYYTSPNSWCMLAALQTCSIIITYESRYIASSSFLEGVETRSWWFPLKSCISRRYRLSLLRWCIPPLLWCVTGSWARMMQMWGIREVSWSLQPCGRWEWTVSIKNESQSNACDVLQICPFRCVVILNVKILLLYTSFYCIPSDRRVCERRASICLYRSVQWWVRVTSLCCWECFNAEVLNPSLASLQLVWLARGSLELVCLRQGWFALPRFFSLPAETTGFYSSIWLCGCNFSSGK